MEKSDDKFIISSKILLYLLPILGITGIVVPLVFGKSNLSLLGLYIAAPMILATIIYIKQRNIEINLKIYDSKFFPLFISIYFILISISIYFLHIFEIRPHIYYLIMSIIFVLILLEILLFDISKNQENIILIQIAILFVNIIWGVNLKYNLFIGRTDIFFHSYVTQSLINSGYITDIFEIYKPFPLWHILCTSLYEVSAIPLSVQKTLSLADGIVYMFVPVCTYLISTKVIKDRKVSLLSALFVVLNSNIILSGMSSISRSVVAFLFIMLTLVLLDRKNPKKLFLALVLIFSIIIYHTASMPFILLILLGIFFLEKFYGKENDIAFLSLDFVVLALSMTFFYWIYYAKILLTALIENVFQPAPTGVLTKSVLFTPLNELFNYLHFSPLLLFMIVGFYATINSKKISNLGKIFCIIGLFTVPVAFPGPSLLINKLASNFQVDRFVIYTFLFIGITSSIGFHNMYIKSKKYAKISIILLFAAMVFLSISNDFVASDNPLVKRPFYTFYFTYEEETAFNHIASFTEGTLHADSPTDLYLYFSKYHDKINTLEVDYNKTDFLRNQTSDVFLIRESELSRRPLKLFSTNSRSFIPGAREPSNLDYYYQDNILWASLNKYNKVYNSKGVTAFN